MKRRDTIIVAVLVNVSLLIVLFVTATKPKKRLVDTLSSALAGQEGLHTTQVFDLDPKIPLTHNNILQQFSEATPIVLPEASYQEKASSLEEVKFTQHLSNQTTTEVRQDRMNLSPQGPVEKNKEMEEFITIIVKKGDFLERIAKANGTTVANLIKINQLPTTQLKIGQVLKVPAFSHSNNVDMQKSFSGEEEFYIVKEGDSPWTIALRHKMKLEELLQLNDLDEYKARRLKPGDQLRIR